MAKFEKKNYHMVKFLNEKIPTSRQFYEFFYVEKMQRIRQIAGRRAELCSFQTLKGKITAWSIMGKNYLISTPVA